jgi:ribosomal protein L40E
VAGLSGLTKKSVYADKILARILGVNEGDQVSYADLSRGLHRYIKDNNLKNPVANAPTTSIAASPSSDAASTIVTAVLTKKCRDCEAEIPVEAAFCDLCGVRQ